VKEIMVKAIPMPPGVKAAGITEDQFLQNLTTFLSTDYRERNPSQFTNWQLAFDPGATAAQLFEKVVQPTLDAGELFNQHSTLTRLYTTLSPEDMTRDPVFSYNPGLAEVSRDHTATLRLECGLLSGNSSTAAATLITEQGWVFHLDNRGAPRDLTLGPAALRIETLREEGAPEVLTDNGSLVGQKVNGCSAIGGQLMVLAAASLLLRRRRAA
jgi:hypothetical protein